MEDILDSIEQSRRITKLIIAAVQKGSKFEVSQILEHYGLPMTSRLHFGVINVVMEQWVCSLHKISSIPIRCTLSLISMSKFNVNFNVKLCCPFPCRFWVSFWISIVAVLYCTASYCISQNRKIERFRDLQNRYNR